MLARLLQAVKGWDRRSCWSRAGVLAHAAQDNLPLQHHRRLDLPGRNHSSKRPAGDMTRHFLCRVLEAKSNNHQNSLDPVGERLTLCACADGATLVVQRLMRKYGDVRAIAWQSAGAALAPLHGGPQLAGYDYNALVKIFRQVLALHKQALSPSNSLPV